ncbi:hypothetical protein GOBAR_AA19769 [Gossypium barbadense]|uniref:Uncharacterized protein n=1 Tax=Gossypium barbadense TaxID=3634 RepID=A0A2P5XC44_GOSBA|nr:hypothetical protein GOBAR_AA19769 [Gossypium barbadense]
MKKDLLSLSQNRGKETVVSKVQGEVDHSTNKSVNVKYKPHVPYPNVTRKDRSDEQFGKFLKLLKKLHINLPFIEALSQMPNAIKFLKELLANKRKLDDASHEMSLKEVHELFSNNNREPIQEDRRLQIEELDEWRTHKLRTLDKSNLRRNEVNTFPNQLKVGDRVLLDTANPQILTTTSNEEISHGTQHFPIRYGRGMRRINSSNHHDHSTER